MSEVLVSADVIFPRTVELLQDTSIDLMRVKPPVPRIYRKSLMWEVPRPAFIIDECDLPY